MKFARVNLEPESFGDHRFAHLARLLAMPGGDGHFALIKVALIWSWQTEHYTPDAPCFHVPEDVIEMALGVDGAVGRAALVRARLAEDTPDGLRMKGSSHDRTGWLWRIRAKSEAGGRAKAATAKRKAANESLPEADNGHASGVPVQSPLGSLLSVPEEPEISLSAGAREPGPPAPPAPPHDVRTMAGAFRAAVDRARTELQTELEVPFPGGTFADRKTEAEIGAVALGLVQAWIRSAPARDPRSVVAERVAHLVAVRSAVARHRRDLGWWAPGNFWRADGIGRDLDHRTPADAVKALSRAGPPREPPRPRAPGQFIATTVPNRPDGEIPL